MSLQQFCFWFLIVGFVIKYIKFFVTQIMYQVDLESSVPLIYRLIGGIIAYITIINVHILILYGAGFFTLM